MTTFTLNINGETKTYGYNPHEAAVLRIKNNEMSDGIKAANALKNAATGTEKARIAKRIKATEEERQALLGQLKECPPSPMDKAEAAEIWAICEAKAAWESLDNARHEVATRASADNLYSAEYVMRYSEELVRAEFRARVFARIGLRQLEISQGVKFFDRDNHPKLPEIREASLSAELFNLQAWQEVTEEVYKEFTQKLLRYRMPSSTSATANLVESLEYQATADWLDGYHGHGNLKYALRRISEVVAVSEWIAANPVK